MRTLQLHLNLVNPFCHFCPASSSSSSSSSSLNLSPLLVFKPIKYLHLQKFNPSRSSHRTHFAIASMADSALSTSSETKTKPFSVLFVCLGNICRSPAAEGVFRDLVIKKGLDSKFLIDSAGTIGYHAGNEADPRMRAASQQRGIAITSLSRPIKASDFVKFDLILAMDKQNKEDLLRAFDRWEIRDTLPDAYKKVKLMCSYCRKHEETEVPDPYYGGQQGFEKVLDLLEDACESLLESILAENKHISD